MTFRLWEPRYRHCIWNCELLLEEMKNLEHIQLAEQRSDSILMVNWNSATDQRFINFICCFAKNSGLLVEQMSNVVQSIMRGNSQSKRIEMSTLITDDLFKLMKIE